MENISQMYICWNTEDLFSDAIILTVAVKKKYPNIDLYVRMFDEELAEIAKSINATTFSSSAFAFEMLQCEVKENSGIYPSERADSNHKRKYVVKRKTVYKKTKKDCK